MTTRVRVYIFKVKQRPPDAANAAGVTDQREVNLKSIVINISISLKRIAAAYMQEDIALLEVQPSYDPLCLSAVRLAGRAVCHNFLKGRGNYTSLLQSEL